MDANNILHVKPKSMKQEDPLMSKRLRKTNWKRFGLSHALRRKRKFKTQILIPNIKKFKLFICVICDFKTKYIKRLKSHLLTHNDVDEVEHFSCDICNFKTKYYQSLQRHYLIHNDIEKVKHYTCSICDYKTIYDSNMKNHIRRRHKDIEEVKYFSCQVCDYKSLDKSDMKCHELVHIINENGINWFKCSQCSNRFKSVKYLSAHRRRMHENGETFICHECGFKTRDKSHLRTHCEKHREKNIKCPYCDFKTNVGLYLNRHLSKHKDKVTS